MFAERVNMVQIIDVKSTSVVKGTHAFIKVRSFGQVNFRMYEFFRFIKSTFVVVHRNHISEANLDSLFNFPKMSDEKIFFDQNALSMIKQLNFFGSQFIVAKHFAINDSKKIGKFINFQ